MDGSAESDGEGIGSGPEPTEPSSPVQSAEAGAAAADGDHRRPRQPQPTSPTPLESNSATLPRSNTTAPPGGRGGVVHCDSGGGLVELTSLFSHESSETLRAGNLGDRQRPRHSPSSSSERLIEMSERRDGYHALDALDTLKTNNRKSLVGIGLVEIDEGPEFERSLSHQPTFRHSNVSAGHERSDPEGDDGPAPADDGGGAPRPLHDGPGTAAADGGEGGGGPPRPSASPDDDDAPFTGVAAITDRLFLRNEHLLRSASRLGESAEFIGRRSRTVWGLMTKRLSTVGRGGSAGAESDLGSIREEEDDEDDDPIMEVMDFLEDEIDEHTYDDLIPLQLRMALEDQVFGWNHFLSNILGHVAYTLGSYLITFWIITFVVLREVPWGGHHADNAGSCASDDGCQSGGDNRPWGMPHTTFSLLRTCISLASAVSTFRTIRRRRRVWLRHPLDGAELSNFEAQRRASSLEEADARARRFVLGNRLFGRMQDSYASRRDRYLSKRVSKKLLKAHRMFERRHRNRVEQIRRAGSSGSLVELGERERNESADSAHERMRMLASPPASVTRKRHRRQRTAPGGSSILPAASADSASLGDDDTVGSAASLEDDGRSGLGSFVPGAVMDSNTLPNFAIESVGHDQMPFSHGEIRRVPYVHGGFFGAAPFMLTNPHWIAILRLLMPDVYVEISRRASYAPAPKLIHWAENNPVVAAYGAAHEIEFSGAIPTLEWDVFLDPHLVWRLEIVLNEKESFLQRQKDAKEQQAQELDAADPGEAEKTSEEAGQSAGPAHTASAPVCPTEERLLLSYYDKEIKRRTKLLVDRLLIAHGNVPQLMIEQTGYLKKYNFSRVKRTRKTLGGGIYARMWLAVFSEAMKLGLGFDDEDEAAMGNEGGDGYDGGESSEDGNSLRSVDEGGFREALPTNSSHSMDDDDDQNPAGPPRKIYMVRNDTDEEGNSTDDGSLSQTSPQKHTGQGDRKSRRKMKKRKRLEKKKKRWNITSLKNASVVADKSIFESIDILKKIMRERYPVRLLLDMKSRHVSRRVWASVVDCLRESGARVEGVASFFVEEVRDISQYCNTRVNEIIFVHSAGDMQQLCHKGAIKRGDKVFFNAGSLLWDYPDLSDSSVVGDILWHRLHPYFDQQEIKEGYRFKPYARIQSRGGSSFLRSQYESETETCDDSTLGDDESVTSESLFTKLLVSDRKRRSLCEIDFAFEELPPGVTCSTIQEYKEHHQLSLGLYVQEFAIDEVAISLLVRYVNTLGREVFDLGLSWGGINGLTVKGIQPGRFTATEGFWIQRYTGMPWIRKLKPGSAA